MKKLSVGDKVDMFVNYEPKKKFYYRYPFAIDKVAVPIEVIGEYNNWYLCMVLPHRNKNGWGESIPYKITIMKHDLQVGFIEVSPISSDEERNREREIKLIAFE